MGLQGEAGVLFRLSSAHSELCTPVAREKKGNDSKGSTWAHDKVILGDSPKPRRQP